jgi:hypothetical protein
LQSLSCAHELGQVAAQRPLQQSAAEGELQSDDVVQAVGQGVYWGFRHSPVAERLGSTFWTVVQQISPSAVLQSVLVVHVVGQSLEGRQMPWV